MISSRTSGSVDPDDFTAATINITTSAVVSSTGTMTAPVPSATSSKRNVGIGVGIGGSLGIALLITLWLLWRQKRHKESFKKEAQSREKKHSELIITQNGANEALQHHHSHCNNSMAGTLMSWIVRRVPPTSFKAGRPTKEGVPINEATSRSMT